ncbi:hypothetical protein TCAL_15447, partial [Tigriopus californicus]
MDAVRNLSPIKKLTRHWWLRPSITVAEPSLRHGCLEVSIPDCSTQTLETAIQRYILPGSHVISDGWAAYPGINQLNG